MAVFATAQDVRDRFDGHLPAERTPWLEARIGDAESLLLGTVPLLADATGLSSVQLDNARRLVVEAVLRVVRNPMGVRDQTVGPYRVSFDGEASQIYFTDAELMVFRRRRSRVGMVGLAKGRWLG